MKNLSGKFVKATAESVAAAGEAAVEKLHRTHPRLPDLEPTR